MIFVSSDVSLYKSFVDCRIYGCESFSSPVWMFGWLGLAGSFRQPSSKDFSRQADGE